MAGEEVLLTLGEVSIAVAGFSSIVAVFGRRTMREWSGVESFRLAMLITNAVGPALLAFLPLALENLHIAQSTVKPSRSPCMLSGAGMSAVFVRSRYSTKAEIPPS